MLILTVIGTLFVRRTVLKENQEHFHTAVQSTRRDVDERMNTYLSAMQSATGLFSVVPVVDVHQFRTYIDRLNLRSRYPGIQGIGYARRVEAEKAERFNEVLQRLDPTYRIWPEGDRPEYHVIMFLEPMDRRNRQAIGYDMFSEPVRQAAMSEARDTGQPVASGKVTLVQEIDPEKQPGFLLYVPVYQRNVPIGTVEERRAALMGFVYGAFRMSDLMNAILSEPAHQLLDVAVYDGPLRAENLMYRSESATPRASPSALRSVEPYEFAGHTWTLAFTPSPKFREESRNELVWIALAVGLVFSLFVFIITFNESRARREGENTADDLRRSEEALRRSEDELRLITDSLPVLVSYVGADERHRYVNRAYEDWFGIPRESLQGKHLREVIGEEGYKTLQPYVETVLAGQAVSFEAEFPFRDSEPRTVSGTFIPQHLAGQADGFVALIADISDRKRLEDSLRESESRFRNMADTAPVMLWMTGPDTLATYYNKSWLDFRGRTLEEEIGTGWADGIHPEDLRSVMETYLLAFNERRDFQSEFRLKRHDGEYRWFLNRGVPRFTPDGAFAGYIGSSIDITERKRAEQEERFMAEASTLLASSLDYNVTLNRVAHLAVPVLADWCAMDMVEPDGSIRRLAVAHTDPEKEKFAWELWERYPPQPNATHGLMQVIRTGEAELF
ncbi:MAG: CHASE domain-containing protein, partial [Armatimonadetes bacterium]|nr:CHASE domain-containing protein [Armatimonadota bacterium]